MKNLFKGKIMEWSILGVAVFLFIYTYFASWSTVPTTTQIGLTFFPRLILLLLIISSAAVIFIFPGKISIDQEFSTDRKERMVLLGFPLSMIALIYMVWYVGMIISMYLFILVWMYFFGVRQKITLFLIPIAVSVFLFYTFQIAEIFIPEGLLF